jgi:hypothetical protein
MLLSKLTLGVAKPPMRTEEILPMGPCSASDGGPSCLSLVPYPERAICLMGLLPGWPPHRRWWVALPRSGLTTWYVCKET